MADITFLEVNLEGSQFTANAPFSGSSGKSKPGEKLSKVLPGSSSSSSGSSSGGPGSEPADPGDAAIAIVPILGLIALVGVYLASRKLRQKTAEEQHELDEFEDEPVEYDVDS